MEIEKLIEIYQGVLPVYKKGYNGKYKMERIINAGLDGGICHVVADVFDTGTALDCCQLFSEKGYYKNYVGTGRMLFPTPNKWKDLKKRIDFMESEIEDLKKLQKKGYTHV